MKENQRVMLTKRLLQDALIRLLATMPIAKISVSQLCQESGINRTTFYRHYGQPRDVLIDIGQDLVRSFQSRFNHADSMERLKQCAVDQLTEFQAHADLMILLMQNNCDDDFQPILQEFCNAILNLTDQVDTDSAKLLAAYSLGGIYFLLRQWLTSGMNKSPEEVVELLFGYMHRFSDL